MKKVEVGQLAKGQIVEFKLISSGRIPAPSTIRARIVKKRNVTVDLVGVNDDSMWIMDSETLVNVIFQLKQLQKKGNPLQKKGYIYKLKREIMTKGFKELLALAKAETATTFDELERLVAQCNNEVTGADFDQVRKKLNIKFV